MAKFPWAIGDQVTAAALNEAVHGGTGADGALSISSGTTTIDCANAALVVKNYTSISITGTAKLAFINPHAGGTQVILKSQGAITVTSSDSHAIDLRLMGGAPGSGGAIATAGTDADSTYLSAYDGGSHYGKKGNGGISHQTTGTAAGGTAGAATDAWNILWAGNIYAPGQGGGGGGGGGNGLNSGGGTGSVGGFGGGSLLLQANGNITISSTIDLSGQAGTAGNGTNNGSSGINSGGGGGGGGSGAGGSFRCTYTGTLSFSGTINISGGTPGAGGAVTLGGTGGSVTDWGSGGGGGSGGASAKSAGTAGVAGTNATGSGTPGNGGGGGTGATGFWEFRQFNI